MSSLFGVLVQSAPMRDPEVKAAVAESRRILAENAALIKELAAVERGIKKRAWKKDRST